MILRGRVDTRAGLLESFLINVLQYRILRSDHSSQTIYIPCVAQAAWKGKSRYAYDELSDAAIGVASNWMVKRSWNLSKAYGTMATLTSLLPYLCWAFNGPQQLLLPPGGLMLDAMGGAISDLAGKDTAFPHRVALFQLQFLEYWFQASFKGRLECQIHTRAGLLAKHVESPLGLTATPALVVRRRVLVQNQMNLNEPLTVPTGMPLCTMPSSPQGKDDPVHSMDWVRGFFSAMVPYLSPFSYRNYIDTDLIDWGNAYFSFNFARLVAVKRAYDSHNVLNFSQSIPLTVAKVFTPLTVGAPVRMQT